MILSVSGLNKSFSTIGGQVKQALCDVSFTAESGAPLGLLGRNGAGKTTAMRIIMNIFPPDSGSVLLDGKGILQSGAKLGYLPEERGLYRKLTVTEQMCYLGRLRGMSRQAAKEATAALLKRLDMTEYARSKLETLSKGNQQKIQLAVALLGEPDLIILDEPFSGLDPVNAAQLKQIVREQSERGALVIFSSHQMAAVEDFCESIVMLHHGQKVLDGKLSQIKRSYPQDKVRIVLDGDEDIYSCSRFLSALNGSVVLEASDKGAVVRLADGVTPSQLMCRVLYTGLPVLAQEIVEPALEDIFVEKAGSSDEVRKEVQA